MGQWVITVAGIAILSVLCDVILPEGQTRKYVKTVFGIVVTLVIVQPVISLFGGRFDGIYTSGATFEPQQQYIESVNDRKQQNDVKNITKILESYGIAVQSIDVSRENNTVSVEVSTPYSQAAEQTIKTVISAYLADFDVITVWR